MLTIAQPELYAIFCFRSISSGTLDEISSSGAIILFLSAMYILNEKTLMKRLPTTCPEETDIWNYSYDCDMNDCLDNSFSWAMDGRRHMI